MPDQNADVLRHHAPRNLRLIGLLVLVIALLAAGTGIGLRLMSENRTEAWTGAQAVPTVRLITLAGTAGGDFTLPGDVQAFASAGISAQVSGTVQKWFVDIGGKVKTGQLLAQLDPRPYQAVLEQGRGQLARDAATLANAQKDLTRYQSLAAQNAISQQQLAAQQASVASQNGAVDSDRATVHAAELNLNYTRIVSPFSGILTGRNIDVGQLITANNAAAPLFTIADQDRLRIYVRMPQNYSSLLHPGMTASFTVPEYPGRTFTATLTASAGAIASASGTQLVQMQVDNADHALKPGSYATMRFSTPKSAGGVRVPVTALIFRDEGMMVAIVGADGKVALKPVRIATDYGTAVDVASGLSPGDRLIDNPPDSLRAGDVVRVAS